MDARVRIPLKTCIRREPHPQACTPPGFEWIPGYLNQHGGQMTDYARNWFIAKWEEPYRAALETAEREYEDCLQGGVTDTQKPSGLQLRVTSELDARTTISESQPAVALSTQVNVHFTPTGGTPPPCDPFDPDHPSNPVDPNAPPVSVPRSVFWKSATATYDLDALEQAMQPVNSLLNPANPLSLRDLQLTSEGVQGAVRITGHSFLPIPAQVQVYDDLQTELEVASIRLDFTAEWANNGAVLDAWSAVSTNSAYTDFYCYYLGCSWWTSPPPLFNWALVPPGCLEDLIFRALPTAITLVRIRAGSGEALDTLTLSINHVGSIDSRPIVARHRIFNSPGTPHQVLPEIAVGPAALGVMQEMVVALPECLVGKVEPAPDTIQDFNIFQSDGVISVSVAPSTPNPLTEVVESIKLRLTLQRNVYHWDGNVDIRFIPFGGVDVGYPPQGWFPHVILRVPVAWNGCDAFLPDRDSQAKVVVEAWTTTQHVHWPGGPVVVPWRWTHNLTLRVVDHAAPCDAFECLWGHIRVTWPNGTVQTQQIMCVPGDIDVPRIFTLSLPSNAPPTVNVELKLNYEAVNRRRNAAGTDFDYLLVPGSPVIHTRTITP
ncbi:MAG: hypothetical protein Q8O33_08050 [Pseudomonadota bacterium]|nr:hypothetical protein [Pseudomonadota bacterium]